jgi:hypothetical protein
MLMHRLSVSDAAKVLGISVQAVHGRVNRGTIEHEREDGKIYVFLTDDDVENQQALNTDVHGVYNAYITSLKSEIESLKQDREVWQEEARRKDHLLAAALERIPALETAEEPRDSVVTANDDEAKGTVSPESEKQSWWRRMFAS